MLSFLRAVLRWLVAFFVAAGIFACLCFLFIAGLSQAFQPKPVQIMDGSVLVLDLAINLVDSPRSVDPVMEMLSELQGAVRHELPLRRALSAVERASEDDAISGILLKGQFSAAGLGNSLATLREFRDKLGAFQAKGKPIWAYVDNDGLAEFYVKSVADEVWMNPYSLLEFKGLGSEVIYWGAALERFGVGIQVERAGKYKTAAESLVASSMSVENREQITALLTTMWSEVCSDIAASRGVSIEALGELASQKALMFSEEVQSAGLVDVLIAEDELIDRLIAEGVRDADNSTFHQVGFFQYAGIDSAYGSPSGSNDGEVAVVYAEGAIVDGEGGPDQAGGDRIAALLREVRKDHRVKAVVLRVNSPGGSVTAAEKILREVELTQRVKPIIVSMGGYAASGGYWIASLADTIFAEQATVTGSIGVFSVLPNIERLMERFDLHVERVETNDLSTMFSVFRPKTEEEMARMRRFVDVCYEQFLERVATGRDLTPETAGEVSQGRVWSGSAALEVGLVDRIGGLEDAIAHAGRVAGMDAGFEVSDYPHEQGWGELISDYFSGSASLPKLDLAVSEFVADPRLEAFEEEIRWLRQINDPRHLYAYSPLRVRW